MYRGIRVSEFTVFEYGLKQQVHCFKDTKLKVGFFKGLNSEQNDAYYVSNLKNKKRYPYQKDTSHQSCIYSNFQKAMFG